MSISIWFISASYIPCFAGDSNDKLISTLYDEYVTVDGKFSDWPSGPKKTTNATIEMVGLVFKQPVLVAVLSGKIYESPGDNIETVDNKVILKNIPIYDSPIGIMDLSLELKKSKNN